MKKILAFLLSFIVLMMTASPAYGAAIHQSDGVVSQNQPAPTVPWSMHFVDTTNAPGWRTAIDIASNDQPNIAYFTYSGSVKFARWNGATWDIQTVDTNLGGHDAVLGSIGTFMRTSLKLDASDHPHISYADNNTGTLKYAFWNGSEFIKETVDSSTGVGWYSSLDLNSDGDPCISYYDFVNGDLKYAEKTGGTWTTATVDTDDDVGWWTSLAIGSDNTSHISYYDKTNLRLMYASNNGSGWSTTDLGAAGDKASSIAVDYSNHPHIAYYSNSSSLRYYSWTGSTWSSEGVPGATVDTGWWNALAFDSADNPHIACFQFGDMVTEPKWNLIYAVKTTSWSMVTVDEVGDVGSNVAIALDSHGRPHVSYQDNSYMGVPNSPVLKYATTAWPVVTTDAATNVTTNSVTLNGDLKSLGEAPATLSFEYGTTTSYGNTVSGNPPTRDTAGTFYANISSGLISGTTYYYRAVAESTGYPKTYGANAEFTVGAVAPTVETLAVDQGLVTNTTAVLKGDLKNLGTALTVNVSFQYGETTDYGTSSTELAVTATGEFNISVTGLTPGKTYHYRALANGGSSGNATPGADMTFPTKTAPSVSTHDASDITINSATLNGELTLMGTASSATLTFEYGLDTNYGTSVAGNPASSSSPTTFTAAITNLTPGVTYHYRAIANGGASGTSNGEDKQLTALTQPSVTTNAASNITTNAVRLNGTLGRVGDSGSVAVSFQYTKTLPYEPSVPSVVATQSPMTTVGVFYADISELDSGTDYHFRAVANGGITGTVYGDDFVVHTGSISPSVTTVGPNTVTNNSALVSGNLTSRGTAQTIYVSAEYGPDEHYGYSTTPQQFDGTGAFNVEITGLTEGTNYHFRVKADGEVHGAAYGSDSEFTTEVTPTVSTVTADVLTNQATLYGNLGDRGTATTINVSFEYRLNTTPLPDWSTSTSQIMPGTGGYSAVITGLIPGAPYQYRAKADGGLCGIGYGNVLTLVTVAVPPAVSTSDNISELTGYSALVIGNLNTRGTASTINVYFEYGQSTGYGNTTTPVAFDGTGAFTATITGLTRGTVYHFRAKADGGYSGIASGSDQTFTTLTPPLVVTYDASAISYTSATLNANLSDMGLSTPPVSVVFEYGATNAYGSVTDSVLMPSTGLVNTNIGGLSSGTLYYFRARVDGGAQGFYYGEEKTFTTVQVSSGGWGGGGGGVGPTGPGVTSLSPYINYEGLFNLPAIIKSEDNLVQLTVAKGVLARTAENQALNHIKILPVDTTPSGQNDIELLSKVYEITPAGATFTPAISITLFYDAAALSSEIDINSLAIGVYNATESRWQLLDSVVDQAAHSVTAQIGHFSQYALFGKNLPPPTTPPPPKPAEFSVSGITASPSSSLPGKDINISVKVSNTGGTQGSFVVILKINGVTESSKTVDVPAGSEQSVSFTVNEDTPGNYLVDINGAKTSFQIEAPTPTSTTPVPTTTPPGGGTSAWLIVIYVVAGLIVIGILAYFIIRIIRSRKKI